MMIFLTHKQEEIINSSSSNIPGFKSEVSKDENEADIKMDLNTDKIIIYKYVHPKDGKWNWERCRIFVKKYLDTGEDNIFLIHEPMSQDIDRIKQLLAIGDELHIYKFTGSENNSLWKNITNIKKIFKDNKKYIDQYSTTFDKIWDEVHGWKRIHHLRNQILLPLIALDLVEQDNKLTKKTYSLKDEEDDIKDHLNNENLGKIFIELMACLNIPQNNYEPLRITYNILIEKMNHNELVKLSGEINSLIENKITS
jgi:hypothetical protein